MLDWSGGGRRTAWPVMPRAVLRAECFWNSEKRHHSLRDSLFWTYLSHLLALNRSPSLVSMPYPWESGNIRLCKVQTLKLLSIKHYIRMSPDCMMLTGAGLNTRTLMPSSAESPSEVLCHLPDLCQVIKLFCMYGTALWRLSISGQWEVYIDGCIQEHAQILIALGSFGLSLRKINLFSLSRFVVSCKNRCWTEVMITFFSCECLTEVL